MALFNFINPLYFSLAWTVFHALWQILAIAILTGIILTSLGQHKASIRYNMLLGSILLVFIVSSITFVYYYVNTTEIVNSEIKVSPMPNDQSINGASNHTISQPKSELFSWQNVSLYINNNIYFIVMIWIIGMAIAFLRLISNLSYVIYLKKNMNFPVDEYWQEVLKNISKKLNITKVTEIVESALVRAPIVVGHLKPMILFPIGAINRLSIEEVESIIAHELAHISRNDYFTNIVVNVMESLFYFHPAMWWLSTQLKIEREHCCDDIAVTFTGDKINYAKSLVAVHEMAIYSPILAMNFASNQKKGQTLIRLNRLFKQTGRSFNIKEKGIASMVIASIAMFIFLAAKPSTNLVPCFPESTNAGNKSYLKYYNNGILDSLKLDMEAQDGDYSQSNGLYDVHMQVVNNHVISFNLNGLEIIGSDISRFKNIIENVILEKVTILPSENNSIETNDETNPVYGKDVEGMEDVMVYDALIAQLRKDKMLVKENTNYIELNINQLTINDEIISATIHQKYLKLYNKLSIKKMNEETHINFSVALDEKGKVVQENLLGNHFNKDNSTEYVGESQSNNSSRISNNNQMYDEEIFDKWLEKQLIEDGYIANPKSYSYMWNKSKFIVDNKEVSINDKIKYGNMRKTMTGKNMEENFTKTRFVTE